jgi:2-aminoethylphosphonate-pyruvate transaminase
VKQILLNPGPVTLSKRVRNALQEPDLCHREIEFANLQKNIRKKILATYGLDAKIWASILLTGSGTAAVEAMITSCIPPHGKILILENGVYGERMTKIAVAHNINHEKLSVEWNLPISLKKLDKVLSRSQYSHVAIVHHETTTGRLNDIAAISEVCRKHGARILMDGVSSFGGENIDFERWKLDACAATANKCLHGVPGTAFVVTRRKLFQTSHPAKSVYLDLAQYLVKQDLGETPFTQSVQCFYALDQAMNEFLNEGGWQARHELFSNRMSDVQEKLLSLGIKPLIELSESSCVLNTFKLPAGKSYENLHDELKSLGFIIYAGQGRFSTKVFRLSLMGSISKSDMSRLLAALTKTLAGSLG